MTSSAACSENSMAPASKPDVSSSVPSALDRSTIDCTSSAVNALATSSRGSTPSNRTMQFAAQLSAAMMGRSTRAITTSGGPSSSAARSGFDTAAFLGTISPMITCNDTMIVSAMISAIAWAADSGNPRLTMMGSSACAIAGSATTPSEMDATVMPSCAHASMSDTCSIAQSTVFAARDPACARGSIELRRAEMIANSAPTKNALTSSSAITPKISPMLTTRPRRRSRCAPCRCACLPCVQR